MAENPDIPTNAGERNERVDEEDEKARKREEKLALINSPASKVLERDGTAKGSFLNMSHGPDSPAWRGPVVKTLSRNKERKGPGEEGRRDSYRRSPSPRRRRANARPTQQLGRAKSPVHSALASTSGAHVVPPSPRLAHRFTVSEAKEVKKLVNEVSNGRTTISENEFSSVIDRLEESGFCHLKNTALHERLFQLFDADGNRMLESKELLAGLALVCKGTVEERLRLTFDLYDTDGSGSLNRQELFRGLKSAYVHAMAMENGNLNAEGRRHAIMRIKDCVDGIMSSADTDGSATIDFQEFKAWGLKSPFINIANDGNPEHNIYLTILDNESQETLFKSHQSIVITVLAGKAFDTLLDSTEGVTAMYCKISPVNAEGNVTLPHMTAETKAVDPADLKWDEPFKLNLKDVREKDTVGISVGVYGKSADGEEKLLGDLLLDWSFMSANMNQESDFHLRGTGGQGHAYLYVKITGQE